MKKFSLKPLGDSGIKMICKSCFFIGLLMTFCLSACSDDDDDAVAPVFPEKQNVVCNAGETTNFTFTTNTNWSLASSAIWCKFKNNDTEEFVMSGTAGTQTITIMATAQDQKVDQASIAKLELTMGRQTVVIGEVTRSAVGSELKILDLDGNEIDKNTGLEVGYDGFVQFQVEANFRFAATNLPGWIELEGGSLVGAVDKKVKGGLKIIQDESREKYPVVVSNDNVITFADAEGKAFFTFPVYYKGMGVEDLEVKAPSTNKFDWTVSLDGKTFMQSAGGVTGTGGSTTTLKNRLPFTVKALNDDYEVVFVEKGGANNNLYLMDFYNEWMRCEREGGKVTLIVDEYDPQTWEPAERVGYVLVFSRGEYEKIKDELEETIIDGENLAYRYEQANLVLQFTQKKVETSSGEKQFFSAKNMDTGETIECTPYTGEDASYYKETYGVQGISEIKQPIENTFVTIAFEMWDFKCYYLDNETEAKGVADGSGTYLTVLAAAAKGKDVFVIVSGEAATDKAMLIVRTSNVDNSGGGETKSIFSVTDNMGASVTCSSYASSAFGNADWIKGEVGVVDLFEVSGSKQSLNVTFASTMSNYTCYDADSFEVFNAGGDIADQGNNTLNVWFGDGSSITKSILLVIEGEDGKKHGLFIPVNS